jgi:4-oxalocrotonate tautomerase family enzyme
MPLVKIELEEGQSNEVLIKMQQVVMGAVVEALKLKDDDRNMRLIEYKKGFFSMKKPYEIIIEITMFLGRTHETKKRLYKLIAERLQQNLGIDKEKLFIVVLESSKENWGIKGGIPADELDLGFNVNI